MEDTDPQRVQDKVDSEIKLSGTGQATAKQAADLVAEVGAGTYDDVAFRVLSCDCKK